MWGKKNLFFFNIVDETKAAKLFIVLYNMHQLPHLASISRRESPSERSDPQGRNNAMNVWQVMNEDFDLPKKYEVTDYLGSGAYGVVGAAVDTETKETFALKK